MPSHPQNISQLAQCEVHIDRSQFGQVYINGFKIPMVESIDIMMDAHMTGRAELTLRIQPTSVVYGSGPPVPPAPPAQPAPKKAPAKKAAAKPGRRKKITRGSNS